MAQLKDVVRVASNKEQRIFRVIDANFNRGKEGLRVCEDVFRFFCDDKKITRQYKDIRHELTDLVSRLDFLRLIGARNIEEDVGRTSSVPEMSRKDFGSIYYANSQRVKESIRVLEEFAKLLDPKVAEGLKRLRYKLYSLEKKGARGGVSEVD